MDEFWPLTLAVVIFLSISKKITYMHKSTVNSAASASAYTWQ